MGEKEARNETFWSDWAHCWLTQLIIGTEIYLCGKKCEKTKEVLSLRRRTVLFGIQRRRASVGANS